jgi:DNA-directed RNA polymerase specialized sigma subunit
VTPMEAADSQINCLTSNEDERQDLWVHYFSGNPPETFASYLQKIQYEYALDETLQERLRQVSLNLPSDKLHTLLLRLSGVEQSIVCLLALGLTITEISKYKGITEIRIRQAISVIKQNDCWEEIYGVEETINRAGTLRSK